jgi:peroxiredoxin
VTVWASWCPGCNAEAAALGTLRRGHRKADSLGVDVQDTRHSRAFYAEYGWRFPGFVDPDGEVAGDLGLQRTRTTIFLDAAQIAELLAAM